jgi:hypothetical protein
MILGTGERPFAESGKGAGHRRDADVPENFPSFDSLPAQSPLALKPLSDSGFIGCVFSTATKSVSSTKNLFQHVPAVLPEASLTAAVCHVTDHDSFSISAT